MDTPSFYDLVSPILSRHQNQLTNNGAVYNPDNGVIAIPETGVWTLTISVGAIEEILSRRAEITIPSYVDSISKWWHGVFLVLLTLFKGEKVHCYSNGNNMQFLSTISGWYILMKNLSQDPKFERVKSVSTWFFRMWDLMECV